MSANETLPMRENILGSRKTSGYVIMVLSILANVWLVSKMHTPNEIAIAALYVIAIGGLYAIGGQALVDSIAKWKSGTFTSTVQATPTTLTTQTTSTTETPKP
jgi:hypothetical protein